MGMYRAWLPPTGRASALCCSSHPAAACMIALHARARFVTVSLLPSAYRRRKQLLPAPFAQLLPAPFASVRPSPPARVAVATCERRRVHAAARLWLLPNLLLGPRASAEVDAATRWPRRVTRAPWTRTRNGGPAPFLFSVPLPVPRWTTVGGGTRRDPICSSRMELEGEEVVLVTGLRQKGPQRRNSQMISVLCGHASRSSSTC